MTGNGARAVTPYGFGDAGPEYGERMQAAANIVIAQLIAALSQNIRELPPRNDARTAVRRRLAQDGRNHRVRIHAKSAPHPRSLVSIFLPASVKHAVMKVP